jgi:hypothetical protein
MKRLIGAVFALTTMAQSSAAVAQAVKFQLNYQLAWDCTQPIRISNFVTRVQGTGVLNPDRSASADFQLSSGTVHFEAKLGGRPIPAPGGTSSLHVAGRDRLRLVWSLRNNDLIVLVRTDGRSCEMNFDARLKPGYHEYLVYNGQGFATCSKPRLVQASCRAY